MILDRFRLDDQVAVVTGAGRGIGAATAIALAEAGADVVISARTSEQLDEVAAKVTAAGRRAVAVPANLNDLDAVAALVDHARGRRPGQPAARCVPGDRGEADRRDRAA